MTTNNFLFEIGCEELPPKSLKRFSEALAENIKQGLDKAELAHGEIKPYATPRRLAVIIHDLAAQQPDQNIERKGPAINAPVAAMEGFLRSNNITAKQLTEENGRVVYRYTEKGKAVAELMPEIINKAIADLPIPKPMRWNNKETQFIRPVHWIVMLYGSKIIPATILGLKADNKTYGHRFHHPEAITLKNPDVYVSALKKAYVIADFAERKNKIIEELEKLAKGNPHNPELLDEVTSIVEWPIALQGKFNKEFLTVPKEALVAAMQDHQKCFPVLKDNKLEPYFITVSNIESTDPNTVIHGNERVINARLSDAKFFYVTDYHLTLKDRLETLKHVIFQAKLGTLYEKSDRIAKLAKFIAKQLNIDPEPAERAGLLSKADLVSNMVNEFPELQGVMGYYYALNDKEDKAVAVAIREHYLPRFAGDALPNSLDGCAVALADRIDTIVGIFGINQAPTGDKDPFGLRRAALGILRILIEKQLDLNLHDLIDTAKNYYQSSLPNTKVTKQSIDFILERLPALYQDKGIATDTLTAVLSIGDNYIPLDIDKRVMAVQEFRQLPEAAALAAANKRVANLLKQANPTNNIKPNASLFTHEAEKKLCAALLKFEGKKSLVNIDYTKSLTELATLRAPVDAFFDNVMVMDEDEKLRNNRLALLAALRQLFLRVADISLLQN